MTAFSYAPALATGLGPVRTEAPVSRPTFAEPAQHPAMPMGRRTEPRDPEVHAALDVPRLTITRMADVLGVPRATLEAYRLGTRRMPPGVRTRLAAFLAHHAGLVREIAAALDPKAGAENDAPPPAE